MPFPQHDNITTNNTNNKRPNNKGVNMLFIVGGEGGNALGADAARWLAHKGFPCAVVGVPKSIDNDLLLVREILIG